MFMVPLIVEIPSVGQIKTLIPLVSILNTHLHSKVFLSTNTLMVVTLVDFLRDTGLVPVLVDMTVGVLSLRQVRFMA